MSPASNQPKQPAWTPSPEGKSQATTNRIIAAVLWVLAIAGEAFVIFWLLKQPTINMTYLIGAIVVIGVLAFAGDFFWKKANQLDPADASDPVGFFIKNQLGAIIAIIAFLPLIVMIYFNKNMDNQQKTLAGGVGVVVLLIAAFMGVSINPPSVQQYAQTAAVMTGVPAAAGTQVVGTPRPGQTGAPAAGGTSVAPAAAQPKATTDAQVSEVIKLTGKDLVFWTKNGSVYHLCLGVSDLEQAVKNNTTYSGTVAQAHAAGMERLTLKVDEEIKQCGLPAPK
jgi:hypothetical protein